MDVHCTIADTEVEVCAHVRGLNVLETGSVYFVAILRLSTNNVGDTAFSTEI